MRSLIVVFMGLLSFQAGAFEVICSCEEPCKQVVFEVEESDLGAMMTVNTEVSQSRGLATVIESKVVDQIVYKLGNRILIQKGNSFRMLGSHRVCGLLVQPR